MVKKKKVPTARQATKNKVKKLDKKYQTKMRKTPEGRNRLAAQSNARISDAENRRNGRSRGAPPK